jgi:isochorismate synthase EntC
MRHTLQPRSRTLSVPEVPSLITTATLWHLGIFAWVEHFTLNQSGEMP